MYSPCTQSSILQRPREERSNRCLPATPYRDEGIPFNDFCRRDRDQGSPPGVQVIDSRIRRCNLQPNTSSGTGSLR